MNGEKLWLYREVGPDQWVVGYWTPAGEWIAVKTYPTETEAEAVAALENTYVDEDSRKFSCDE